MNIFINNLGQLRCLSVKEEATLAEVHHSLALPPQALLHFNGHCYSASQKYKTSPTQSLKDLQVQENSTLQVTLPLVGGAAKCNLTPCPDRVARLTGICRWCEQAFCAKHRLPESHECNNLNGCRQQSHEKNSDKLINGKCVADKV